MGTRLTWTQVPRSVRDKVELGLGAAVVATHGARGGYSPALACVAELSDGREVFLKAACPAVSPQTPGMMRAEAVYNRALRDCRVAAPALLDAYDDGTWVVLTFDAVRGVNPSTPWRPAELSRVAQALGHLAQVRPGGILPPVGEQFGDVFTGWTQLSEARRSQAPSRGDMAWWAVHLADLRALESDAVAAVEGAQLVHGDLRSDNILLTDEGDVMFVDWTTCGVGPSWLDASLMAPSVLLEGGPVPEAFLARVGLRVPPQLLLPVVAGLAGYFVHRGTLPDPPGLPTVREFQRAQGEVCLAWLRRLLAGAASRS